jgi:hypothetical protein
MTALGIDRRILRAFYTQYIAVLLIVLVFFVAAFQRPRATEIRMAASIAQEPSATLPLGAPIALSSLWGAAGLEAEHPQLLAISQLLRAHDVEATFVFGVAVSPADLSTSELSTLSARVDALERFFEEEQLPRGATRYVIEQVDSHPKDSLTLLLRPQGGPHE